MSSSSKYRFIDDALDKRKKQHRFRELTSYTPAGEILISDGDDAYVNFSGNDYLGLSKNPRVIDRAKKYADQFGTGATASRLINGTFSIHEQVESKLAETFGRESALIFNSGFQANSTIISTLADRHSLILADKLSHNSLLQGSFSSRATFRRFEHNSTADLERHLRQASRGDYSRIIVLTESLFSMDGDRSDLEATAELCDRYEALLFVDDAHAIGVYGKEGLGLSYDVPGIDMVLGTCGKAFGGFGAFLLSPSKVRNYLVNFCPGFIYTTALPPAVIGAMEASLELIPGMVDERQQLHRNIKKMRKGIEKAGFSTGNSESQIIPIIVGGEQETIALAEYLKEQGFLATAIRPPTVPKGSARIRITLSSGHTEQHLEEFEIALNSWNNG